MTDPVSRHEFGLINQSLADKNVAGVGNAVQKLAAKSQKHAWSSMKTFLISLATVLTGGVVGLAVIGVHAHRANRLAGKQRELLDGARAFYRALQELQAKEKKFEPFEKTFKVAGERVKLTYDEAKGARMHFLDRKHDDDCKVIDFTSQKAMEKLEKDVMRHSEIYGRDFAEEIFAKYEAVLNHPKGREQDANVRNLVDLENRANDVEKRGRERLRNENALFSGREYEQGSELALRRVPVWREAHDRIQAYTSELLTSRLGMNPGEAQFLEAGLGLKLSKMVISGGITSAEDARAFINRNASGTHFTTAESRRIYEQFEQAESESFRADVLTSVVSFRPNAAEPKADNARPPEDVKDVHAFVAELISSDYAAEHDESLSSDGHTNGRRLRLVMDRHRDVAGRLMANRADLKAGKDVPDLLEHIDPALRDKLNECLDKLNARFDRTQPSEELYLEAKQQIADHESGKERLDREDLAEAQKRVKQYERNQRDSAKARTEFLRSELHQLERSEKTQRSHFGTDNIDDLADEDLAQVHETKFGQENDSLKALIAEDELLQMDDSRRKLMQGLDFFAQMEKDIQESVGTSMTRIQGELTQMIDEAFGEVAPNKSYTAAEMQNASLADIIGNPSANGEMRLVREVLKDYFTKMPAMDQRAMIASMTRFSTAQASQGAKLGALLKGAGPVMQKMLQGLDENLFQNADFRAALADMRSNLAPISERAVRAYLYDIVKQSKGTDQEILEIKVDKVLGAASVAQVMKCTMVMAEGGDRTCIVKMLRPEAELRAMREQAVFNAVAKRLGGGMDRTFAGRFQSILEEMDLRREAENITTGNLVYDHSRRDYQRKQLQTLQETYGSFANVHSMRLAPGAAPEKNLLVLEEVPGTTLEKYNRTTAEESTQTLAQAQQAVEKADDNAPLALKNGVKHLTSLYEDARAKYEAVRNFTYMWVNEALFAEGFYHGDVHKGNLMVPPRPAENAHSAAPAFNGITLIDFGNATRLDDDRKKQVLQVVAGCAVGDPSLFLKGFEKLLTESSRATLAANRQEIDEKLAAILGKGTLADTAPRLSAILEVLQRDYQIEVPSEIHNFLESQRRLQAAMDESAQLMKQIAADRKTLVEGHLEDLPEDVRQDVEAKIEAADAYRPLSMVECLTDVVKQNLMATLKAVGIRRGSQCWNKIESELELLNRQAQPQVDEQGRVQPGGALQA